MAKYGQIVATGIPAGVTVIVKDSTGQQAVLHAEPNAAAPVRQALTADSSGAIFPRVYAVNGTYTVVWTGGSQSVTVSGADGDPVPSAYVDQATQAELDAQATAAAGTYVPFLKGTAPTSTKVTNAIQQWTRYATVAADWMVGTENSTTDNLLTFRYNFSDDLTARQINDVAVRHGFESNYLGMFEWNLDLMPSSGSTALGGTVVRPWYYTYEWATGASRLEYKGSMVMRPWSSNQGNILEGWGFGTTTALWYITGTGAAYFKANAFIGADFNSFTSTTFGVKASAGTSSAAHFQSAGGQSASIVAITNTSDAIYSHFDKAGYFMTRKIAAPADADLVASEMALWLDSTNGAAKMMVKAKQADGTVRTGSLALA